MADKPWTHYLAVQVGNKSLWKEGDLKDVHSLKFVPKLWQNVREACLRTRVSAVTELGDLDNSMSLHLH